MGHKRSFHALRWKTRLRKNPFSITPEKLRVTPQRLQRRYHRHLLLAAVKMLRFHIRHGRHPIHYPVFRPYARELRF